MFGYVPLHKLCHNWSHEWWPIIPPVSCKAVAQKAARDPSVNFPRSEPPTSGIKSIRMATGNSNAALLLVTGLLTVSMAAMGLYYLQLSKKTPTDNNSGVKGTAEVIKPSTASPNKVLDSPKKVVAAPKQVVNETPKSSPVQNVKEVEPPVHELPKPTPESPKKTTVIPGKVVESPKKIPEPVDVKLPKETPASPIKTPASPKKSVESPKKAPASPIKASESPRKVAKSPEKVVEASPAVKELDDVARKLSEEFITAQAASETASAFADELLQESLENIIALEQEEYVQVELTQSMTLSQSTPELINIEDAVTKDKEVVRVSAATEDEESIVEEEEQEEEQTPAEPIEPVETATDEPSVEEEKGAETLASPKSPNATPASWEAIASSPVVKAAPADEAVTPLVLDTPAETIESTESLSINVPAENTEASAEDKDASSPVSSGGSSPGKRNRNRSKKAKSKRKKGKKHQKFKA